MGDNQQDTYKYTSIFVSTPTTPPATIMKIVLHDYLNQEVPQKLQNYL